MEVICKGYKLCENRDWCSHAKPHQFKEYGDYCYSEDDPEIKCCCNSDSIRKIKLEKIKNGRDS
jgi:hypothetical protein